MPGTHDYYNICDIAFTVCSCETTHYKKKNKKQRAGRLIQEKHPAVISTDCNAVKLYVLLQRVYYFFYIFDAIVSTIRYAVLQLLQMPL